MARPSIDSTADERELLEAVRRGDREAYGRLVEPYRSQLQAHCYRMLGSVHDAEDALQDTLLRAWRGLRRFEGRSSLRTWLFQIATNASLKLIERRPKRMLPIDHGPPAALHDAPGEPLVESVWVEPYPDRELGLADGLAAPEARYDQRESVELAFVAALQHLPARQRASLILHDVLGFSAREVAASLDTTMASVNSALQRARRGVDERVPEQSQQATLRSLGDEGQRQVIERYIDAWDRADVDALVALLAEGATWSMRSAPTWYRGLEGDCRLPDRLAAPTTLAPAADARERTARGRLLSLGRRGGAVPRPRARRAHPARSADPGCHGLRHAGGVPALRAARLRRVARDVVRRAGGFGAEPRVRPHASFLTKSYNVLDKQSYLVRPPA